MTSFTTKVEQSNEQRLMEIFAALADLGALPLVMELLAIEAAPYTAYVLRTVTK